MHDGIDDTGCTCLGCLICLLSAALTLAMVALLVSVVAR